MFSYEAAKTSLTGHVEELRGDKYGTAEKVQAHSDIEKKVCLG